MEDIEELAVDGGGDNAAGRGGNSSSAASMVKVRAKRGHDLSERRRRTSGGNDFSADSFVPGVATIHVHTWGCAHNASDGEYMSGLLAAQGYTLTQRKEEADLWLLNSCAVKNPAEDHFRNEVEAATRLGKRVVAAGCVSQGRPKADYLRGVSVVGVQQIDRVVEVVEETLKGNTVRLMGSKKRNKIGNEDEGGSKKAGGAPLDLPKVRRNPLIEIIAVSTGCLNQCTYCKTKHARGDLGSYPPDEIVARAVQSFEEGVVEIWLTSEDTGAYGRDIGSSLPELLHRLVEVIPEGCRMRVGMTNPPYILDHLDEMAEVLGHPRVYAFLHVPVQSGSDAVLRDMRREYNVDDFSRVVNILRKKVSNEHTVPFIYSTHRLFSYQVPGITIVTDVICGFPTETEQDFEETMILCRKYKFPSLFINQFFPRPGTPAASMGVRVPTKEVKRRTRQLSEFFQSYRPYEDRVGRRYHVLVTEEAHDGKHYVGHNRFYEQVLLPKEEKYLGKLVEVEIESATKFSMVGRPLAHRRPRSLANSTSRKKSKSGAKTELGMTQMWMYKLSIFVLALAITIRLVQVFHMHLLKGPVATAEGEGSAGGGATTATLAAPASIDK